VTVALTVMSFCQDFGVQSVWAFAQDTGGKQAATVLGWANMWGNFGAGIGPKLIGGVAVAYGWNAALLTMAASLALSGLAGLLTNAAEPLFRSDEAES
jgi:nitrate/nitrite transporter NarK